MFLMERATDDPAVQQRGISLVVDFRGVQFSRFASIVRMDDVRRGVLLWKGAFPCRLRRVWLLDPPYGVHYMALGVLSLLSQKVRDRVRIAFRRSGLDSLVEDLSPLFTLPKCLGGAGEVPWHQAAEAFLRKDGQGQPGEAGGQA